MSVAGEEVTAKIPEFETLESVTFRVPGNAVPRPRQRHAATKSGKSFNYTPKSHPIHDYQKRVADAAHDAMEGVDAWPPSTDTRVTLGVDIVLPRPAYLKRSPPQRVPCGKKVGDVDNYAKSVMDAMNGIVYEDDAQVTQLFIEHWYAAEGEDPHTFINLELQRQVKPQK